MQCIVEHSKKERGKKKKMWDRIKQRKYNYVWKMKVEKNRQFLKTEHQKWYFRFPPEKDIHSAEFGLFYAKQTRI